MTVANHASSLHLSSIIMLAIVHSDILPPNNPLLDIRIESPNFILVPSVVCSHSDHANGHIAFQLGFDDGQTNGE